MPAASRMAPSATAIGEAGWLKRGTPTSAEMQAAGELWAVLSGSAEGKMCHIGVPVQTAKPCRQWLRVPLLPRCRYVETARLKQEKAAGWPLVNKVSPASAGMLTARTACGPQGAKLMQCSLLLCLACLKLQQMLL